MLIEDETLRVLVIVGRDTTEVDFEKRITPYLYDNFDVKGVYALGDPQQIDDTEWFIAFVAGNETDLWNVQSQKVRIERKEERGRPLRIETFDDMDDALSWAKEEYNFDYSDIILQFRDRAKDVLEKYGFSTAAEVEMFKTVVALAQAGMLVLARGIWNESQVPVLANFSEGSDGVKVTPVAILVTEEIKNELELPMEP